MGSTHELLSKLFFLSSAEVGGIPGVAVECVDIGRNTSGEGRGLGRGTRHRPPGPLAAHHAGESAAGGVGELPLPAFT